MLQPVVVCDEMEGAETEGGRGLTSTPFLLPSVCLSFRLYGGWREHRERGRETGIGGSLHRSGGAGGLDRRPANVQPGELGAVLEQLLDGHVAHMQLRGQGVLLLDDHR